MRLLLRKWRDYVMKFLNSEGLRMVLSKIKDKFATKEELKEIEKKSTGGGMRRLL